MYKMCVIKASTEIACLMLMTMTPELQNNLEQLGAYDMLQELKTMFSQPVEQELLQTFIAFHACKHEEGYPMSSYVLKMKCYIDNLERLGHPMSLNLAESLILVSLSKEYDNFKNNNKNKKPQNAVKGKNQGNGKSKLDYAPAYVPKPKIPPTTKKDNPAKDVIYHECSKIVSRFKDNGFVNCFIDNGIYVSKDGLLYFHSIPRDGIYEIDLYYDNSNDKSIHDISNKRAKLNLDYTLLWHYHLRHISKKQIEKLQHDGILKSTNHESFDKCVSCMSGKITHKPYSHQVERAKDLFELIHTDVCGLFRICHLH
ncbi:zinc finger, CCHC-type containing protein [Tanacetum coccineum]